MNSICSIYISISGNRHPNPPNFVTNGRLILAMIDSLEAVAEFSSDG